jgi:SAM-dependent methyltransferase
MGERVTYRTGDVREEDLGTKEWDLIFLSQVVHHFDEPTNRDLVRRAARALRAEGVVAIVDVLRPAYPNASGQTGALLDLYFGVTSKSGTWSQGEITSWYTHAALRPRRPIGLRAAPGITVLTAGNEAP